MSLLKHLRHCIGVTTLLAALATTPLLTHAAPPARGGLLTPDEAAARVQRQTGGQALAVERESGDSQQIYRVRVVTRDGRVRVIRIDARSGRVIR